MSLTIEITTPSGFINRRTYTTTKGLTVVEDFVSGGEYQAVHDGTEIIRMDKQEAKEDFTGRMHNGYKIVN